MSNTEALRAALQAAREARGSIPLGAERSALNVALDRLDVALSAAAALAQQPAETDAELQRRTGEPHIDGWPLYSGLPPPTASGEPPEPFGYVITHNFPEGHAYRYSFYTPKSIGTAYRDTALSITPVFANAQPAPAPAEPVAEVLIDSCADHESRIEAMAYLPAGTMLYRAPQPAPALVPPGWVLVPVNATPEMKAACVKAAKGWWDSRAWPAMLAAASRMDPALAAAIEVELREAGATRDRAKNAERGRG